MTDTLTISRDALKWSVEQLEEDGNKGTGYFDTLRALLAAPVVERQVCYQHNGEPCQCITSPPAPVAVALPERREASYYADGNYSAADLAAIWNAAIMSTASLNARLDKVKEMNR